MKKNFPFFLLLTSLFCFNQSIFSQKTWVGTATGGSWNTDANWSGGVKPGSNDDVVITTTDLMTIVLDFTNSTIINSLTINGTHNVIFTTDANRTINLGGAGTSGTALNIAASRALTLNSPATVSVGIILSIPTNYTATINGTLNLAAFGTGTGVAASQSNQLLAVDANSVQVNSGGAINANARNNGTGVYPFGATATNNNIIVFNSGSSFTHYGGNGPWGSASAPAAIAEFKSGSTFNVFSASTPFNPSLAGRSLGNLVIGCGCTLTNVSNASSLTTTIENLTVNSGTMALFAASGSTALPTYSLGNISLGQSGTGTATLSLRADGASGQTASYTISGNIVLGNNSTAATSSLNFGNTSSSSGGAITNITFTGVNKSLTEGSAGTKNFNISTSNSGSSNFTTNIVLQTGASFTFNKNMLLDNTANSTISLNINPTATLTIAGANTAFRHNSATNTFTNNGLLVIASTAAGTARIANSTGAIPGNVTVQRFIPGGNRRFRFISHPFKRDTSINIVRGIDYTGANGTANGFSINTGTNSPSVFMFNTATADGGSPTDAGWTAFTAANTNVGANAFKIGQGIRILVRGAAGQGLDGNTYVPRDTTISMTGNVNTGNVDVPLVLGGSGTTQDFNLIGNPYPAPVNIGAIVKASSLITAKTIYVRNPATSAYLTKPVGTGDANDGNYTLNSLSAFFVKANSAGNLVFAEANKVTTESGDVVFADDANVKTPMIELEAQINGQVYDNYIVKFSNQYSKGLDKDFDAVKMQNDIVNLYSKTSEGKQLGLDARNFSQQTEIPLGLTINNGKQTITLKNTNNYLSENMEVVLWDKLTNIKTPLVKDAAYTLELDKDNVETIGEDRLVLLLSSKTTAVIDALPTASAFTAKLVGSNLVGNNDVQVRIVNPLKANTNVKLVNTLGQLISNQQGSQLDVQNISISTKQLLAGKYFVEVQCGTEKQVIQIVKN